MSKDILPFPLSTCPTAAEISVSLESGRAQLGQAKKEEVTVDEYLQEAGLEAWTVLCHGLFCLLSGSSTSFCLRRNKEEWVSRVALRRG